MENNKRKADEMNNNMQEKGKEKEKEDNQMETCGEFFVPETPPHLQGVEEEDNPPPPPKKVRRKRNPDTHQR